ncbi:unnamed protein product [Lactuca virosa]|uniref:Uncharacterized protein n=1 Tax=Lactuca virosa TaxID=75947 RepID=A0AAU9MEZ0_9ASTR|nr:unnamed protein product [Lactuca virosa]
MMVLKLQDQQPQDCHHVCENESIIGYRILRLSCPLLRSISSMYIYDLSSDVLFHSHISFFFEIHYSVYIFGFCSLISENFDQN